MIVIRPRPLFIAALAAGLALAGGRPALAASSITILSVQTGHSVILNADGLTRVAVGDGRIAGVVPIGTSQLVINGKAPGHTTIFVWTGARRTTYEVTVTEQSVDDIARMLRGAIGEPDVQVISFNHSVVLKGQVPDAAHFTMLTDIVSRFDKVALADKTQIVNAVTVTHPLGNLQQEVAAIPGASGIRVDPDPKGNVVVSGRVRDRSDAERVLDRARGLAGPYLATDGKVIDRLAVETTSQIDVKVYVLEVDKTAQSQLGLRLQGASGGPGGFTTTAPQFIGIENPKNPNTFGRALNVGTFARATLLAPTLDLMLTEGHAKLLSSPNLVTVPGQTATFLVGGEIPIPMSNGLGTVTVTFKEFGVKLQVTPVLLGNGGVETKIAPEVSDLDFADGVSINGFVIPALKTSKLSTDVITQSGESIVMGGLLRRVESRTLDKIPLLGDLPILGKLFRSTKYLKQESDVVFIMTPTVITK